MVADFREQLTTDKVKIDEEAFTKDVEFIQRDDSLRDRRALFGVADARRHLIAVDPQAQVALTLFGEAQKLTELSQASTKAGH